MESEEREQDNACSGLLVKLERLDYYNWSLVFEMRSDQALRRGNLCFKSLFVYSTRLQDPAPGRCFCSHFCEAEGGQGNNRERFYRTCFKILKLQRSYVR